jgi:hypothetical protein
MGSNRVAEEVYCLISANLAWFVFGGFILAKQKAARDNSGGR